MKMVETIEEAVKFKYCLVEMRNRHRHTIKAYGVWNVWCGSPNAELENQKAYIEYMAENERTEVDHFEVTNSEKDAVKNEIIDRDLGFI